MARRSYGTGQIYQTNGSWYGRWRTRNGARVNRKLGKARARGMADGLTRLQAEAELRKRIDAEQNVVPIDRRLTVEGAGDRVIARMQAKGRKKSHRDTAVGHIRRMAAYFDKQSLDSINEDDLEDYMAVLARNGLGPKTIRNYMGTLSTVFKVGLRGTGLPNPVSLIELPQNVNSNPDIRFLTLDELDAVLRAAPPQRKGFPPDPFWPVDRVLYEFSALAGPRQGESLALRWVDVDWIAGKARIRQNYVSGEFTTPKSRRGTRAVPMADRVMASLDRHHQVTAFGADRDLVFADQRTGEPMLRNTVTRRFKQACERAGVRVVRFHDLRHTFGTHMAATGVPMRTLQEWMGHANINTTEIYADYRPSESERDWARAAFDGPTKSAHAQDPRLDRSDDAEDPADGPIRGPI